MKYNCSKKAFCCQKLFWPFTVWINCSSDLKNFTNSQPSASNFKSFFQSLGQFFLTVGQNNFSSKLLFLRVVQKNFQNKILVMWSNTCYILTFSCVFFLFFVIIWTQNQDLVSFSSTKTFWQFTTKLSCKLEQNARTACRQAIPRKLSCCFSA